MRNGDCRSGTRNEQVGLAVIERTNTGVHVVTKSNELTRSDHQGKKKPAILE